MVKILHLYIIAQRLSVLMGTLRWGCPNFFPVLFLSLLLLLLRQSPRWRKTTLTPSEFRYEMQHWFKVWNKTRPPNYCGNSGSTKVGQVESPVPCFSVTASELFSTSTLSPSPNSRQPQNVTFFCYTTHHHHHHHQSLSPPPPPPPQINNLSSYPTSQTIVGCLHRLP